MPQGPNPLIKPFVVLALPGMYLFYKYNQYKRKRKENAKRRLTERELQHLNNKIDKLLSKLEESEPELATCQEEECVICIHAKATMQTAPCGHQVVCRKCFVKTIQIAVSQRLLPLRCVICRAKILRLKTGPILPSSASGYSVNSKSSSVPQSDSLYSVSSGNSTISSMSSCSSGDGSSGGGGGNSPCCSNNHNKGHNCLGAYPRQPATAAQGALLKRSQQHHAIKMMKLQDYRKCRGDGGGGGIGGLVNRLPPIKEISNVSSPTHSVLMPPASTRIRCAQKILTQLENGRNCAPPPTRKAPSSSGVNNSCKYEKLSQNDSEDNEHEMQQKAKQRTAGTSGSNWWSDKKWKRSNKSEENDNKRNEIMEKQNMIEMKHKGKLYKVSSPGGKSKKDASSSSSTTLSEQASDVKEKKL